MADARDPAGAVGQPDHSTLEVVEGHYHDKAVFSKNDKVAYVPSRGDYKVVVQQETDAQKPATPGAYSDQNQPEQYSPQTTYAPGASAWKGDAFSAREPPQTDGGGKKILGLKRRTCFTVMWVASLLVAIGVGVGVGVGVSMRSSSGSGSGSGGSDEGADLGSDSAMPPRTTTPGSTGAGSADSSSSVTVTGSASRGATPSSVTLTAPRSTAAVQIGGVGGRCSNNWGADCICLDRDVCVNRWQGEPMTGTGPGDWPCPDDPNNIVACIVKPCLGKPEGSQCMWSEACRQVDNRTQTASSRGRRANRDCLEEPASAARAQGVRAQHGILLYDT
ncbi:hypothetical protein MYCTH_2306305 [Thermothelomyces thermophilus ATCC 42464]|uniref:Uncharacterized protein n=1 Tax=Thermothelomyces thermophilus (strain ATCC 42464 / BCRC 31852 / DSM 1799) TaxID=573729 RepID=G2QHA2_THET4|nr:uncharacterized protein MYCTH_2306305 [Thermothelomyces thermophilus ATCC 42464]AEO58762.1 hypothetical protein MYCTH_2306305 [Thermothelomyces thermophilus ATCC 42464]